MYANPSWSARANTLRSITLKFEQWPPDLGISSSAVQKFGEGDEISQKGTKVFRGFTVSSDKGSRKIFARCKLFTEAKKQKNRSFSSLGLVFRVRCKKGSGEESRGSLRGLRAGPASFPGLFSTGSTSYLGRPYHFTALKLSKCLICVPDSCRFVRLIRNQVGAWSNR